MHVCYKHSNRVRIHTECVQASAVSRVERSISSILQNDKKHTRERKRERYRCGCERRDFFLRSSTFCRVEPESLPHVSALVEGKETSHQNTYMHLPKNTYTHSQKENIPKKKHKHAFAKTRSCKKKSCIENNNR